jgi:hypothetical protein
MVEAFIVEFGGYVVCECSRFQVRRGVEAEGDTSGGGYKRAGKDAHPTRGLIFFGVPHLPAKCCIQQEVHYLYAIIKLNP